jgi:hypothetical protein
MANRPGAPSAPATPEWGQTTHATPGLAAVGATLYVGYTADNRVPGNCTQPTGWVCHNLYVTTSASNFAQYLKLTITTLAAARRSYVSAGPGMAAFNGHPYIAWAGADTPQHIGVGWYEDGKPNLHNLASIQDATPVTPALFNYQGVLYLAFTGWDGLIRIRWSYDGVNWPLSQRAVTGEFASAGPGIAGGCWGSNCGLFVSWVGCPSAPSCDIDKPGILVGALNTSGRPQSGRIQRHWALWQVYLGRRHDLQ